MEKIEAILEEDEKILWKYITVKNLYWKDFAISLIIINPANVFTIYYLFLIDDIILKIIISLFPISITIIFLYLICKIPSEKRQFIERYQLSSEEYKKYQEIYTITNIRWIQKNYRYIENVSQNYYLKKFVEIPRCIVQQKGDILSANLKSFQIIKTWKSKKIEFFISYDYYFLNSTDFVAEISSKQDFQELVRIIKDTFPIEKEELHKRGEILFLQN